MGNLLYFVALILAASWVIGFFGYGLGAVVHVLLVLALISLLIRIISGRKRY